MDYSFSLRIERSERSFFRIKSQSTKENVHNPQRRRLAETFDTAKHVMVCPFGGLFTFPHLVVGHTNERWTFPLRDEVSRGRKNKHLLPCEQYIPANMILEKRNVLWQQLFWWVVLLLTGQNTQNLKSLQRFSAALTEMKKEECCYTLRRYEQHRRCGYCANLLQHHPISSFLTPNLSHVACLDRNDSKDPRSAYSVTKDKSGEL